MTPKTLVAAVSGASEEDFQALDQVLEELRACLDPNYFSTMRQVALRLRRFLEESGLTVQQMVDRDLGQRIAGSATNTEASLDLCKNCLRSILEGLCKKGRLALAFERCVLPARNLNRHADPRGLTGYPEAVTGIYPKWLVPERFQRAIDHNAAVPAKVRQEFRAFAEKLKKKLNEASLLCYWEKTRDLALATGVQSLTELRGKPGIEKLRKVIEVREYDQKTTTVIHWRRILRVILGSQSPFQMKNARGEWRLELPEPAFKPEGAGNKRHKLIDGVRVECRMRGGDLKKLTHYENPKTKRYKDLPEGELAEAFRDAQEDLLVKFWCILKDRPAELWAHNIDDWKLYAPQPDNPDFQMFNGDGEILNNFRESIKKSRPNKPFPKWLDRRFREFWQLRRAYFGTKGNRDQEPSQETGLLRPGVPLWVDPRTGRRASSDVLRTMLRRGLVRAGIKPEFAQHISGYWFRKGVISSEFSQGKLDQTLEKTSGHKSKTAHTFYITEEMALLVEHERRTYWRFLGINQVSLEASGDDAGGLQSLADVKETARKVMAQLKEQCPELLKLSEGQLDRVASTVAFGGENRVSEKDAAAMLDISESTLRRWSDLGLLERFRDGGRVFYLATQVRGFLDSYVFVTPAAKLLGCSDSYLRRLCRIGTIAGAQKVGRKSYRIPWTEVRRLMAAKGRGGV